MTPHFDVPGYEIQSRVGQSALTEVWTAWQPALQRRVHLKVLKPHVETDPDQVERFIREARMAANLRHPAIVSIYNVVRLDCRYVVIMEHAEGPSLFEMLGERGRLPWARSAEIAVCVAEALQYAWNFARLIHRCVSPTSIRLEAGGAVKFAYVGLSLRVDPLHPSQELHPGCIEGVPYYMSPEQAEGSPDLDIRTDMYGLGATLYHMITGRMPFGNREPLDAIRCQREERLPNPTRFCRDLPPSLLRVMARLMGRRPVDRYADWTEAIAELRRAGEGHVLLARQNRPMSSVIDMGSFPPMIRIPCAIRRPCVPPRPRLLVVKKG